jgi:hypothetical protein
LIDIVKPAIEHLRSYRSALDQGWSPDNVRPHAAEDQLEEIERDPAAFIAAQDDPDGREPPIKPSNGSVVPRLPGYHRWM